MARFPNADTPFVGSSYLVTDRKEKHPWAWASGLQNPSQSTNNSFVYYHEMPRMWDAIYANSQHMIPGAIRPTKFGTPELINFNLTRDRTAFDQNLVSNQQHPNTAAYMAATRNLAQQNKKDIIAADEIFVSHYHESNTPKNPNDPNDPSLPKDIDDYDPDDILKTKKSKKGKKSAFDHTKSIKGASGSTSKSTPETFAAAEALTLEVGNNRNTKFLSAAEYTGYTTNKDACMGIIYGSPINYTTQQAAITCDHWAHYDGFMVVEMGEIKTRW